MNWTVGQKIGAGFAVPLVVLLAVGGVAYYSIGRLVETASWTRHTQEVLAELDRIDSRLTDAQVSVRGFLIYEQDPYLEPYQAATKALPAAVDKVSELTADNPRQQARTPELRKTAQDGLAEYAKLIQVYRSQGRQAAIDLIKTGTAKEQVDRLRSQIEVMVREETDLLRDRERDAETAVRNANLALVGGTLAAAALVGLLGTAITRSVTRPVRGVIAQLAATSTELLAGTTQQASGAQTQAAAVTEVVTTVDEVTQTSDQAAHRAKGVGEAIRRTHEIGRAGRQGVEDSIRALTVVQDKMGATAQTILALAEQAQAIGEIIATVNDIAEQTNVLALNAAIEASRAGHEGRGFAVVAGEVKALADQSKKATAQVRKMLGDIQKATNAAVLSTEDVSKGVAAAAAVAGTSGDTIRTLADTLADAAQAVEQVVASAGQQAIGMSQIHQAMRNIETVARQNAAALQQTEEAARGLSAQGDRLSALVGR